MILRLATSVRDTQAQAIITALDAGTGPGTIEYYSGTIPTNLGDALTTQVKLGTVTCSKPAGTKTGGVFTFSAIAQANAVATGTAAWVYFKDSAGAIVGAGDVTDNAGTGFIKTNTTAFVAGGPIATNSLTITMGGA